MWKSMPRLGPKIPWLKPWSNKSNITKDLELISFYEWPLGLRFTCSIKIWFNFMFRGRRFVMKGNTRTWLYKRMMCYKWIFITIVCKLSSKKSEIIDIVDFVVKELNTRERKDLSSHLILKTRSTYVHWLLPLLVFVASYGVLVSRLGGDAKTQELSKTIIFLLGIPPKDGSIKLIDHN